MKSSSLAKTCFVLVIGASLSAANAQAAASDVSGTWNWTTEGRDGQVRESTLTLKQDGNKVTGTITGRGGEMAIQDGKITENELAFKITRETQNGSFTAIYKGKVQGDKITGNRAMSFGDRKFEREWAAKRKSADPSGTWAWSMVRDTGETWEATLKLKRDGDAVAGAFNREDSDFTLEIREGKVSGTTLTFETVFERDGESVIIKNTASITGDTMKGKSEGESPDGEKFSREWMAKRK